MNRRYPVCLTICLCLAAAQPAAAGNHPEVTWIPLQPLHLVNGRQDVRIRLPADQDGVVPQAVFILGRVVQLPPEQPAERAPASMPADEPPPRFTVKIKCGARDLPAWELGVIRDGYVVNLPTIAANPARSKNELLLQAEVTPHNKTRAYFDMTVLGCPDVPAVTQSFDGTLDGLVNALKPGDARDYFAALRRHFRGELTEAAAVYQRLASGKDELLARFARRGLRTIRYQRRVNIAAEDYRTQNALAMYLQQCGTFGPALAMANAGGDFSRESTDNMFRIGELLDRLGNPPEAVCSAFSRPGFAADIKNPTVWQQLVLILESEQLPAGAAASRPAAPSARLTRSQVERVYLEWFKAQQAVFGASNGMLRIYTHYIYYADEKAQSFTDYPGGLRGPADDVFAQRGAYDGVISIRPRGSGKTVGADMGPNGAALSDMGPDADWGALLAAWQQQFTWAMKVSESGPLMPSGDEADGCGIRPLPSRNSGRVAAMRYYVAPATYRKTQIAGASVPGSYVRRWNVEGPYAIADKPPASGEPQPHLLDVFPPAGAAPLPARKINSASDFIDLHRELGKAAGAVARARCWVYSPDERVAAMWLGFNDGLAAWVNGKCVRRGDYFAAHRWADANLTDLTVSYAYLHRGWNRLEVAVESRPAPHDKGWGFSLRLADWDNQPIPGMAYRLDDPPEAERAPVWSAPRAGPWYDWDAVSPSYTESLPQLTADDLSRYTGVSGLTVRGDVKGARGWVAIGAASATDGRIRPMPDRWDPKKDADWTVNNLLDWSREDVAAFPFRKDGVTRALLLLRPEVIVPFLSLLREVPEAQRVYQDKPPSRRVVGYISLASAGAVRPLLVVDVMLGEPKDWPIDQEDLLTMPVATIPISATAPANR